MMKPLLQIKLLLISVTYFVIVCSSCKQKIDETTTKTFFDKQLSQLNTQLTQVIISDIFTPAVCSRIFAYSNIAAYEGLQPAYQNYKSYAGQLNQLKPVPQPAAGQSYNFNISSALAFTTVAQKMVFNGDAVKNIENNFIEKLEVLNIDEDVLDSSIAYGRRVGDHILEWAAKDGYLQRTSFPAYIVTKEAGRYQPTPPNYIDAVETNWKTLRPFVLDSASQFRPMAPVKYDTAKSSAFYKEAWQVYDKGKNLTPGDSATAWYWDDNPNTSITNGHITYFQQKNSPPGHWIHIACAVAEKEKFDAMQTASLLSKTAVAMADAFISAWEAKFIYNYIRPETFINAYIDKDWLPLIQTPPFPEYPSAHSVASASAATVLTKTVGDNYAFIDSAEVPYGRPTRKFNSFYEAADQASISRLYGGIHFITAIDSGKMEGRKVGGLVMERLK